MLRRGEKRAWRRKLLSSFGEVLLPQRNVRIYKAISQRICESLSAYMRKFIGVYAEENFRICRNIFPYIRKFFFAYAEIYFRIYGNFPAYIRRSSQGVARPERRSNLFPSCEGRWSLCGGSA